VYLATEHEMKLCFYGYQELDMTISFFASFIKGCFNVAHTHTHIHTLLFKSLESVFFFFT